MADPDLSYDELKQRLQETEDIISILRDGQVDAVVGKDSVAILRLAEAEKQLRRSQMRLQVALEASGGGVYERAVPPDEPVSHTPRWAEIIGYRPEEIPSNESFPIWFSEQVHPDDRARLERAYREFIEGKTEQYAVEVRLRHQEGHWIWVRDVSRATERDGQGRVRRLVGVMSDITKYRRTEEELRASRAAALNVMEDAVRARRRVEEAEENLKTLNETLEQQVADRTALAERRARDLRRLAAELSEAEHRERKRLAELLHDDLQQLLLAVKLRLPALVEDDGSQLQDHVERLDELVGECLSTSRNLSHELSPSVLQQGSLAEVIQWIAEWFADKHKLAVTVDSQEGLPAVAEHVRVFVFQAVRELLFNVIKHSGSMAARVGATFLGDTLSVRVEDQGRDFDPAAIEARLQEPEGFGLFNIGERLETLGGRFEIQATPQSGARFQLQIPVTESSEAAPQNTEAQPAEMPTDNAGKQDTATGVVRLLVVDDHAVVREGLVGLLSSQPDLEVVGEAANGEEAMHQADALRPTVIIMDVDMPETSGLEATRHIKAQQPEAVIVGLSLHEDETSIRAMTEAGTDAYISKHAATDEVLETIRGVCSTRM